jgi:hypothetical protein
MQKMTRSQEVHYHLLQLKQNNQEQWRARISTCHHLLYLRKKPRDDNELPGLSLSSINEEKKLRDEDEPEGSSLSLATQEKLTSRFFFLGCRGRWRTRRLIDLLWVFCLFFLSLNCRKQRWVGWLVIVFCNVREKKKDEACSMLSSTLVSWEKQKTTMNVTFIVNFCRNFVRTIEDENEWNTHNCFFCKGTKVKKNKEKKGLMYIYCHRCTGYLLEEHFL